MLRLQLKRAIHFLAACRAAASARLLHSKPMRVCVTLLLTVAASGVLAGPYDGWQPHAYCNDLAGMDATAIAPLSVEQAERVASLEQVQVRSSQYVYYVGEVEGAAEQGFSYVRLRSSHATALVRRTLGSFAGTTGSTTQ